MISYIFLLLMSALHATTCKLALDNVFVSMFTDGEGHKTLLYYTEMNKISNEEVVLECSLPIANWWDWRIHGKVGSPHAKNMIFGYDKPIKKQWIRTIDHGSYPWDILLVSCTPMHNLKKLITKVWVISKLSSSSDRPLHPMVCAHPDHRCQPRIADCYYGSGVEYHGKSNFSKSGACQPWDSVYPNSQTSKILQKYAPTLDYWGNHNYCRNPGGERQRPYCVTSADRRGLADAAIEECYVPQCNDCAYGVAGSGKVLGNIGLAMHVYGSGYCVNGQMYAGWDKTGSASLEECLLLCLQETQCKFVAYLSKEYCYRYKEVSCKIEFNGEVKYFQYTVYSKLQLGISMHYHGTGSCSKGYYAGLNFRGLPEPVASKEVCLKLCIDEPKCLFVVYDNEIKSCVRFSWPSCIQKWDSNTHNKDISKRYTIYKKVAYPKYEGRQLTTVKSVKTSKGNIPRTCYIPNQKWKDNTCQWRMRTILGRKIEQSEHCRCLVRTKTTSEGSIEDPHDSQIELVDCLLRQCLVRQVYFLVISPSGYIFYLHDNEEFIEIDVWLGTSPAVSFLPIGIVDATELKVMSLNKLQATLPFKLVTRSVPSLSELQFNKVQMDAQGKYFFEYTFGMANKILQDNVYRGNFKIVVITPTKIELKSSDACPGMNSKVGLQVIGSVPLDKPSITWEISYDEKEWTSADLLVDIVEMYDDSYNIMLKNVRKTIFVRVRARSGNDDLDAATKIGVKTSPALIIPEQNVEVVEGRDAHLVIEYESNASTRWIHNFKVIDQDDPDKGISFSNDLAEKDNMNRQVLTITGYTDVKSGIYTVEVERDKCVTTGSIYLSSM